MPGGRPSSYKSEYAEKVRKLALLGATDVDMAAVIGVTVTTFNNWKLAHPEFVEALKEGRDDADANVASRLYNRAMGYSHKAVKIFADAKTGNEHIVEYVERYPPDVTACIFWLKNRQRAKWRDRVDPVEADAETALVIKGGLPDE